MIWYDHLEFVAAGRIEQELRDEATPLCTNPECQYRGTPSPDSSCPRCGAPMQVGDVYVDDELEKRIAEELASVGKKGAS